MLKIVTEVRELRKQRDLLKQKLKRLDRLSDMLRGELHPLVRGSITEEVITKLLPEIREVYRVKVDLMKPILVRMGITVTAMSATLLMVAYIITKGVSS